MKLPSKVLTAAVLALGAASFIAPANAAPIAAPSSLHNAAASPAETVAWRGGWRGRGWGPAAVAGAVVGGVIAAAQPWTTTARTATIPAMMPTPTIQARATAMDTTTRRAIPIHRRIAATPIRPATPPVTAAAATMRTARNASAPTTRRREPIWATMAGAIRVRDAAPI